MENTDKKILSYKEAISYIWSDYEMYTYHGSNWCKYFIDYLRDRSIKYTFWLRLASYRKGWLYPLCWMMWKHYSGKYCIDIRPETKIGKGLRLPHGMCVVINSKSIIGENVRLYQNVTIGEKNGKYPTVGNNVTIYPNSVILGGALFKIML